MSKNKLSKQQQIRIKAHKTLSAKDCYTGIIVTRSSNKAMVEDYAGKLFKCDIRRNIDSLAVGDVVDFAKQKHSYVIVNRHERKTVLGRPNKYGQTKVIAANVDQMLIVCAPLPQVSFLLIDSYLVAAENLQITPIIVVNKIDLNQLDIIKSIYEPLGYQVIFTCAHQKKSLLTLSERLKDHISVFVGQSGVGKSSLINGLHPNNVAETQEISDQTHLGRHTTSNSFLYHLPDGGDIIDSPGIRQFALWDMPKKKVLEGFMELKASIGKCKYKNCTHLDEPHCAIEQAAEEGKISPERYSSLISLLQN